MCAHGRDERPLDLGPGGGAPGVQDAGGGVAALSGQGQIAAGLAVEHRTQGDQLVDTRRALVDEHPHRVDVTQPGPGGQGVGQMEVGGVLVPADAPRPRPPGPSGSPTGRARPWSARPPAVPGASARRTTADRPGHAGAEDEDVELHGGRAPEHWAGRRPQPVTARPRATGVEPRHGRSSTTALVAGVDVDDGGLEPDSSSAAS